MENKAITSNVRELAEKVEATLAARFAQVDRVAMVNTERVMAAFSEFRVSDTMFSGTTGYGYNDIGRETLDKVWARVFGTEEALVRIGFVNGTHAISSALFAATKPNKALLAVTGEPYDTLHSTIGISDNCPGSLKYYGVDYSQVDLLQNGKPDLDAIARAAGEEFVCAVTVQRSRGYSTRAALSVTEIGAIIEVVRSVNPSAVIVVDNCYGEFVETIEPSMVGADLIAGSLIKNAGGGLAATGGYVAGKKELVEAAAMRLTAPGIGGECGATLGQNRSLFQGLFMAPHIVAQALKTSILCAGMLEALGYKTSPGSLDPRSDIIQMIELGTPEALLKFCRGIQRGAPVDSFVTPEAWQMPGYDCPVVMAAGAFVQGSSIELSADGPMREPYLAFLQGGLTYESGRLGVMMAISEILDK